MPGDTRRDLHVTCDIRVIPDFVDCGTYRRADVADLRQRLAPNGEPILVHMSNFRPVKRVTAVVDVFARVRARMPARLLMVGDGPDAPAAARLARDAGGRAGRRVPGRAGLVIPLLSASDVFLLPSAQESFGLAALEAMACGVPVVASRVGGIPEVVDEGVTGFLHDGDDLDGMASSVMAMLSDRALWQRMSNAAGEVAHTRYCDSAIVPLYESYYELLLNKS